MLRHLGRLNTAGDNRRSLAATVGRFACVNADLIFDVAFSDPAVFLHDFEACCRSGVDQISTYPLMHFGFTPPGKTPHAPRAEHELLRRASEVAERLGYERRSVWTFNRVGGPLYASIARELYLGTGAGAATFTGRDFLVNNFGLEQYGAALAAGRLPIARRVRLDAAEAALYCAFWQLYAPGLDLDRFRRLFPGARWIAPLCGVLTRTGHLTRRDGRVRLTEKGFDRYHDAERWVTYHLIEPLWGEMLEEHGSRRPGSVSLRMAAADTRSTMKGDGERDGLHALPGQPGRDRRGGASGEQHPQLGDRQAGRRRLRRCLPRGRDQHGLHAARRLQQGRHRLGHRPGAADDGERRPRRRHDGAQLRPAADAARPASTT